MCRGILNEVNSRCRNWRSSAGCRLRARMWNDGGCDVIAKAWMGDCESSSFGYGWMA